MERSEPRLDGSGFTQRKDAAVQVSDARAARVFDDAESAEPRPGIDPKDLQLSPPFSSGGRLRLPPVPPAVRRRGPTRPLVGPPRLRPSIPVPRPSDRPSQALDSSSATVPSSNSALV